MNVDPGVTSGQHHLIVRSPTRGRRPLDIPAGWAKVRLAVDPDTGQTDWLVHDHTLRPVFVGEPPRVSPLHQLLVGAGCELIEIHPDRRLYLAPTGADTQTGPETSPVAAVHRASKVPSSAGPVRNGCNEPHSAPTPAGRNPFQSEPPPAPVLPPEVAHVLAAHPAGRGTRRPVNHPNHTTEREAP
jgi:hypothetical protein